MGQKLSKVTEQDRAILDLKSQRDKLQQYQKRIVALTARETEIARQMLAEGDRPRALLALRRKKYQETLLSKADSQLAELQHLTSTVEFALIQKDVLFGLQQGTDALREIHREMGGLEQVEKLMGETADAIAYQREVSEILGGRITNDDEDLVEQELDALEAEATVGRPQQSATTTAPLPAAPAGEPVGPAVGRADAEKEDPGRRRESGKKAMLAS